MQYIFTKLTIAFLWVVSLLPLGILYLFSDFFYLIVRLIGYRKKVVEDNLRFSFPGKDENELRSIRNKFYHHFCDLFVETIKLQHISESEMRKRVKFKNIEYIDKLHDEGKDVVAIMAHYNNWEWVTSINLHCKALGCDVYRPLKNKAFDSYMLDLRSRWGNLNFAMRSTLKDVIKLRRENQRFIIGLIADQSPGEPEIQYWTNFLNQNTAVLTGPEKIAKLTKSPVVYLDMQKVKRGYYEIDIVPLLEDTADSATNEITELGVKYLEKVINKKPEHWLWSHKRWKYSKNRLTTSQSN